MRTMALLLALFDAQSLTCAASKVDELSFNLYIVFVIERGFCRMVLIYVHRWKLGKSIYKKKFVIRHDS